VFLNAKTEQISLMNLDIQMIGVLLLKSESILYGAK